MADPYIDPYETKAYGKFAREQMAEVLVGKNPVFDHLVEWMIGQQLTADMAMNDVLDKLPKPTPLLDSAEVLDEARDTIVRFGAHLDSLKGRPVDPKVFFRGDAPSVIARRRLMKLTAAFGHVIDEFDKYKAKIRDADHWRSEIVAVHAKLAQLEKQQRASRVEKVELGPELTTAREAWLDVYNANKQLVRGMLAHLGKPELLPLIFDDLAEIHRAGGVSDALPEGASASSSDA